MRMVVCLIVLVCAGLAQAQEPKTVQAPPELTQAAEKHQLQATIWALQGEVAKLRAELADRDARLTALALNTRGPELQRERDQLEAIIRATAGAPDDAPVDWTKSPPTVTWTPVKKDPKP